MPATPHKSRDEINENEREKTEIGIHWHAQWKKKSIKGEDLTIIKISAYEWVFTSMQLRHKKKTFLLHT